MSNSHICTHCHFTLDESQILIDGKLDEIEDRIEDLFGEWEEILVNTISDPLTAENLELLKPNQKKLVKEIIETRKLPEKIDVFFVDTINLLIDEIDKVNLDIEEMFTEISKLGPCTVDDLKARFESIVEAKTKGKDKSKLRIIICKE